MQLSLEQLAHIVINSVFSGLKGVANISLDEDQVMDEINMGRNRFAPQLLDQNQLDREGLLQSISALVLTKKDIRQVCPVETSTDKVLHTRIPKLLYMSGFVPVKYIGHESRQAEFKIFYGNEFMYRNTDKYTAKDPTVWIDGTHLWLFHPPAFIKKRLSITAAFENPRDLAQYKCCEASDGDPYPMPAALADVVTSKMINDYLRYYRMQNPQPNTGNEFTDAVSVNKNIRITTNN